VRDRIVKGGASGSRKIQFEDFDAIAARAIAVAQAKADALLAAAQAKADALGEVARAEGLAEGRATGAHAARVEVIEQTQAQALRDATAALAPVIEVVKVISAQMQKSMARYDAAVHEELVELAIDIARKVVGREIQLDPELVAETVRRAVALVLDRQRLTIRLHPQDADLVAQAFPEVETALSDAIWTVQSDESVDRGGAVIETEHGEIDGRISTQLDEIGRALISRVEDEDEEAEAVVTAEVSTDETEESTG